MKRFAAHRLHRLDALEVKTPPAVKGLSAHTVAAADVFNAHASRELSQDLLSDCIGASKFFHFFRHKKRCPDSSLGTVRAKAAFDSLLMHPG